MGLKDFVDGIAECLDIDTKSRFNKFFDNKVPGTKLTKDEYWEVAAMFLAFSLLGKYDLLEERFNNGWGGLCMSLQTLMSYTWNLPEKELDDAVKAAYELYQHH